MGKKITFCTYDAPLFHSVNTWLKRLLPDLATHGFSIEILIFYEGELKECETYQFFVNEGFEVKTCPFKHIAEDKIKWILTALSKSPPDIFVANMLVHAFFAAKWIKKAGIPTIGLIHSDDKFYYGIMDEFVNGDEEYRVTAVVSCSKYLHQKVSVGNPFNIVFKCIPYGVPTGNIPKVNFDHPKLKLIYIGRLVETQKRISDVVKAICKASAQIDGVEGIIYGHGDNVKVMTLIERYSVSNKVKFGGSISNTEIFNSLSKAHVFVLLSDYEGLPQSLLEAMACGLVPVCSEMKSGIPELVTTGETGIIIKNRDSAFIDAIQRLKADPILCRKISKNVQEKALEYSSDECTTSWINLLNELLTRSSIINNIEIPTEITLPKPHPYLKVEDFRIPSSSDKFLSLMRKTRIFSLLKKLSPYK